MPGCQTIASVSRDGALCHRGRPSHVRELGSTTAAIYDDGTTSIRIEQDGVRYRVVEGKGAWVRAPDDPRDRLRPRDRRMRGPGVRAVGPVGLARVDGASVSARDAAVMRAMQDAALDARSRDFAAPPTDDEIRSFGEAYAVALGADPSVLRAEYSHADRCVSVTLTAEAMGFPLTIEVSEPLP